MKCVSCDNPRWLGPKGTNPNLTMCEHHQREYWRERKAKRQAKLNELRASGQLPPRQKPGRKPGQKDVAPRAAKRETKATKPAVSPEPQPMQPQRRQFNIRPFTPSEVVK